MYLVVLRIAGYIVSLFSVQHRNKVTLVGIQEQDKLFGLSYSCVGIGMFRIQSEELKVSKVGSIKDLNNTDGQSDESFYNEQMYGWMDDFMYLSKLCG